MENDNESYFCICGDHATVADGSRSSKQQRDFLRGQLLALIFISPLAIAVFLIFHFWVFV